MRPQQSFTFVSFTTGASGASILFGFLHALLCVFSAKVLAASFSFWIGRFNDGRDCLIDLRRDWFDFSAKFLLNPKVPPKRVHTITKTRRSHVPRANLQRPTYIAGRVWAAISETAVRAGLIRRDPLENGRDMTDQPVCHLYS
ncbi:hypothetical protein F2Q70_00040657 [Brassica cretica]|uniref:Uncharacterized protein n=1 Tax=Brassica cretica TaxID=69181 RepID=A0A8S9K910_BRACR|nr:hypothetical protein F2Q70_00040657 [Brassica cretica]